MIELPRAITRKWISKRSDGELKELLVQLHCDTCRYSMVMREVEQRKLVAENEAMVRMMEGKNCSE